MRNLWALGWKLLLISAIAGILLGATNLLTKGPIKLQEQAEAAAAREEVLPQAQQFVEMDGEILKAEEWIVNIYQGVKDGQVKGYALTVQASGFGGAMNLMVGIDENGTLQGIKILTHNETPGLGAKAADAAFRSQFAGRALPLALVKGKAGENEISAITGATVTSTGVSDALNRAGSFLSAHQNELAPKQGGKVS